MRMTKGQDFHSKSGGDDQNSLNDTMNYFKTNVIQKKIHKQEDTERSVIKFNYPYQALEEAVVKSLYHRSYNEREPVEITIEPGKISILNFGGPNHTISMQAIREARMIRTRRYTNRRLGEFLKELDLTEGRATGYSNHSAEVAGKRFASCNNWNGWRADIFLNYLSSG